jgi:glycosyltransferase involved in cell wall biosynthesis
MDGKPRMPLSILHFSTADNEGGSGRAAYRIHSTLRELGHRSRMLVGIKVTHDPDVDTVFGGRLGRLKDRAAEEVTRRLGLQYQFVPSGRRVLRHPWLIQADVIQLFNTHGGYFSPRILPRLAQQAPIVWRLSDMWTVTGHCAYAGGCERWQTGCGHCPDIHSYPPVGIDRTAWLWRQKRRLYARSDITVVAPSSWTEAIARRSPLFEGCDIRRIPNGIDTQAFKPRDRTMARTMLDLDPESKLIVFVAHVLDNNPRKGASFLMQALPYLKGIPNAKLLLVGVGGDSWSEAGSLPIVRMGYVGDDRLLAAIYNSADVIVAPSVLENLPNTVLEAMACGVPAVAFDAGGMKDAVKHDESGVLVPMGDVEGLARGVRTLLTDDAMRARLARNAVSHIQTHFSKQGQGRSFEALYLELLDARSAAAVRPRRDAE